MIRIYLSASTQKYNIGVSNYGNEQDNMFILCDKVEELLKANGNFIVFRNQKDWSLYQTVNDINNSVVELAIDNHSNASGYKTARGCEVWYWGDGGLDSNSYRASKLIYDELEKVTPSEDRGVKPDTDIDTLYFIQKTTCPSLLVEHFFHTSPEDVEFFKNNIDDIALSLYKGICKYFGVTVNNELETLKIENRMLKEKIEKIRSVLS